MSPHFHQHRTDQNYANPGLFSIQHVGDVLFVRLHAVDYQHEMNDPRSFEHVQEKLCPQHVYEHAVGPSPYLASQNHPNFYQKGCGENDRGMEQAAERQWIRDEEENYQAREWMNRLGC